MIYNIGSLNIDYVYQVEHFVRPGETISSVEMNMFPGGKGLNQSVAAARAGAKVCHCGMIGTNGDFLVDILNNAGADTKKVKKTSGFTGHAIIQVDSSGQNCIMLYPGANSHLDSKYIRNALSDAKAEDILLMQNEVSCPEIIMDEAHRRKMQIVFNPSPFNDNIKALPLEFVDWWIFNETEGAGLTGKTGTDAILDEMLRLYSKSRMIMTLGGDGSVYKDEKKEIRQKSIETTVVDTTACGDTFTGYFFAMLSNGFGIDYCMKAASLAASITASNSGAAVSIPELSVVSEKIKHL